MIEYVVDNLGTIVVGAMVALVLGLIIAKMIKAKKAGKSGCGSCCSGCPSAGICHTELKDK